ncbi:MAG: hypothetical protein LQ350_006779 [Teloschistes chrysophthalmus]|nr:MAG: hypothetical protein LQ350_006779 [Niorma chrysophthalma]
MIFLLGLSLFCLIRATSSPSNGTTDIKDVLSAHNTSLPNNPLPIGPEEFDVKFFFTPRPQFVDRKQIFDFVTNMLAAEALKDFNGLLPGRTISFFDPRYPHITIVANSLVYSAGIPRSHLFWGMARIMDHMTKTSSFIASSFGLVWQSRPAGGLSITLHPPGKEEKHVGTTVLLRPPGRQQNATAASHAEDFTSFEYQFHGSLLSMEDVCMGSIGALVQAAQLLQKLRHHTFVGGFVPYHAVQSWSSFGGATLDREMVVKGVYESTRYAIAHDDFHELNVRILELGLVFAEGGYVRYPPLTLGLDGRVDISTS